jgi:hypothetical protein
VHWESISGFTGARAAVWRPCDDGEETTEEVLGAGSAWVRREGKESRERCSEDRVGYRPFIGGQRHRGFMAGVNASA